MSHVRLALVLALLLCPGVTRADTLDDALAKAGMSRGDLGWRPRGWWAGWPATTYRNKAFDDLLAEPLAVVPYLRGQAWAAKAHLGPEGLAAVSSDSSHAVYRAVVSLGVDVKHGGFRAYSANLIAPETPLDQALLELLRAAGRQTRFVTFGTESPYPLIEKELAAKAAALPPRVSGVLGKLVLDLLLAQRYAELAFRKVPREDQERVAARLDLGVETTDGLEYPAEVDDVARAWDEACLWYAALRSVEALDQARRTLAGLGPFPAEASFDWESPWGWIRVRGGGADTIPADGSFLLVDLGGDDRWEGGAGASAPGRRLSLALDLAGNDVWKGGRLAQGSGVCGVGLVLDAAGDDTFEAGLGVQGFGQFGLGALVDLAGTDRYRAGHSAQGCGFFGIGLLLDAAGNDEYHLLADGQGLGGVGGVGVLADRLGDDLYRCEPDPALSGRPSYHSELKVSVSNAQGVGLGRRGDGSDGHNWAGGVGMLLDAEGKDRYLAGNWAQGTGYWFGIGLIWDGAGDDAYEAAVWAQGSGAHFCVGAHVDEAGDDTYTTSGYHGLAFAHDFAVALFLDGAGKDRYRVAAGDGIGYSINRSVAVFADLSGDDEYQGKAGSTPGFARWDARFADPAQRLTCWHDASSLGLFLDLGGTDRYWTGAEDGASWGDAPGSDNWKARNRGLGLDLPAGTIDWSGLPERATSGR